MHMFLMGIFWYHLYDMSNYKLCNLDTYNHNFGSRCGNTICFILVTGSRIAFAVNKTIATHTKGHIETLQT